MSQHRNESLQAALRELELIGATEVVVEHGKHLKVRFIYDGQRKVLFMASTPSDWRATENTRRDLRRVLREASK